LHLGGTEELLAFARTAISKYMASFFHKGKETHPFPTPPPPPPPNKTNNIKKTTKKKKKKKK